MSKTHLPAARESLESLKQTNEHGAEYWSARKLQPLLGYSQWRRFEQASVPSHRAGPRGTSRRTILAMRKRNE